MITFNEQPNYRTAFQTTARGLMMLGTVTAKHIMSHKAITLLVFSILINVTQFNTIARQRIDRDRDSVQLYQLAHQLDSINNKEVKYMRFK